jgi:hypothetical protein
LAFEFSLLKSYRHLSHAVAMPLVARRCNQLITSIL